MKKCLFIVLLFCLTKTKAQYVTIPDAHFASYLQGVVPTGISNNQLDTTSSAVKTLSYISVGTRSISNLNGLQYFTGLTSLDCSHNQLTALPKLPPTLQYLQCSFNQLTSLPALPSSLTYLQVNGNLLSSLPSLPDSLYGLYCYNNHLTILPSLPQSLIDLFCYNNQLTSLPTLPDSLKNLNCSYNQLNVLPPLPNLDELMCNNNNITCFPVFPNTFQIGYNGSGIPYSTLNITANPFNCLPNYVDMMDSTTLTYPLCGAGNSTGCPLAVTAIPTFNTQYSTVLIYPNPARNNFTVETNCADKQTLSVSDVNNNQILTQFIIGTTNIDVSSLSAGVYNISLTSGNSITNKKLVIVK